MANSDRLEDTNRVEDLGGDGVGGTISAGALGGEMVEQAERADSAATTASPGSGGAAGIRPSEIADGMPGGTAAGGGPGLTTDGRS